MSKMNYLVCDLGGYVWIICANKLEALRAMDNIDCICYVRAVRS